MGFLQPARDIRVFQLSFHSASQFVTLAHERVHSVFRSRLSLPTIQKGWEGEGRRFTTRRSIPKGPHEPFLLPSQVQGKSPRLARLLQKLHIKCPVRAVLDGWKDGEAKVAAIQTAKQTSGTDTTWFGTDMSSSGCLCWPLSNRRASMTSTRDGLSAAQQLLEEKLAQNGAVRALHTFLPEFMDCHNHYVQRGFFCCP